MVLVVSVVCFDGIGEDFIVDGCFVVEDGVVEFVMLVVDVW